MEVLPCSMPTTSASTTSRCQKCISHLNP